MFPSLSRFVIRRITFFAERKLAEQSSCYFYSSLMSQKKLENQLQDAKYLNTCSSTKSKSKSKSKSVGKSVVVVESVTKAKAIEEYLPGDMYKVVPSGGHVRDLANWPGSVLPDEDFSMVWLIPPAAAAHIDTIKLALTTIRAKNLILALDPDREGEAIAWHIIGILNQQGSLWKNLSVSRIVFNEITESSIKKALLTPRQVDLNLVQAYLSRRALEYLIGFNIMPLLLRKLPGCEFPGRVQSAALALICDREIEIDQFQFQPHQHDYWTINLKLSVGSVNNVSFPAHLIRYDSNTVDQLSNTDVKQIQNKLSSENLKVLDSKTSELQENPPTPYITSTLLQDASKKLRFSVTYTMKLAQKLYEGIELCDGRVAGLITYTRTNGFHISDEVAENIHSFVVERYGQNFASVGPRKYVKEVKNSQESHEAIRPTDISRLPSMLWEILDEDSLKLYTLIWSRTVACQMELATIKQIQVDIGNASKSIVFCSTCSVVEFLGHEIVFKDVEAKAIQHQEYEGIYSDEVFRVLDSLKIGDPLYICEVEPKQHHTQAPPRYFEGTLVKKMEELGIGRSSSYASALNILQERNYVTMKNHVLHPQFHGRMVSAFLNHHFPGVVDHSSTADMETKLDNVSVGLVEWKCLLRDFWTRFSFHCETTNKVQIHQVEKMLEKKFEDFLFASCPDKSRICPSCIQGTLVFKVHQSSASYYVGCDQSPQCKCIVKILHGDERMVEAPEEEIIFRKPKLLGLDPRSNEKIFIKSGRHGLYVQLGEGSRILKRVTFSHIKDKESITLKDALELLQYPMMLGTHPDDGQPVMLTMGIRGVNVRHRNSFVSVPKAVNPKDVDLAKALEYLSGENVRRVGRGVSLKGNIVDRC